MSRPERRPSADAAPEPANAHAGWNDSDHLDPDEPESWPLDWGRLDARGRWLWFERLWFDVCRLRERYLLPVRSGWWESGIVLEALAATAAWVRRYDSGEWDDPPGKLALLYDLERVAGLLRDGHDPFSPDRDRAAYVTHMIALGCDPPDPAVHDDCQRPEEE